VNLPTEVGKDSPVDAFHFEGAFAALLALDVELAGALTEKV
jgi:hypothetical protein